jgi:hypothetical protein
MSDDSVLLHLQDPGYALLIWEVVGADELERKLAELRQNPQWGWTDDSMEGVKGTWELLRSGDLAGIQGILPEGFREMTQLGLLKQHSARWISDAFEGIPTSLTDLQGFTPPPATPCLYAADNRPHYLHLSTEKDEILLQVWIYCRFDRQRFNAAIRAVWAQYAKWTKFACGYAGESGKFAAALRTACDQL